MIGTMSEIRKPHIKRVRLLHTGVYVWGLFRTASSLRPVKLSHEVRRLVPVKGKT